MDNERSEEEREFAAITDDEIFSEARDRLEISNQAESKIRPAAREAIKFREGDQWDDSTNTTISDDEPELTINLTDALCMRVENNIRQQRPRGKCHPVGDGADVEMAEIINGIGRHVETRSEASVAYDMAASHALTAGWGYFRIIAEYLPKSFQRDLRILPIRNLFTVNMDPSAIMPSGADQTWCIISEMMKWQEYRRRYPKAENAAWNDIGQKDRIDWEDKESIRLAEYFRIRQVAEKLVMIRGQVKGQPVETTRYRSEFPKAGNGKNMSIDDLSSHLEERGFTIEGEREDARNQVEWFRLNGIKVVERQQLPGMYIPVFRVEDRATDIDGEIYRRGMVESMMDPQRMVNYGEVAKIKRLGLAPKAPWIGYEGQFEGRPEWDDANKKSYSKLEHKVVVVSTSSGDQILPPPTRQQPAQIEQGFSEFVQGMRSNLMSVAGAPNEPGMDQQGVVVSGKAIDRRQFLSDQSHYHVYDNLTLAIAQCWRVIVDWAPAYFGESGRIQRIIGEDSTPEMVTLNQPEDDEGVQRIKNDLSVGRYDVVMDTGPGYDSKREEGAENMIQLMGIPALAEIVVKTAPDLLFRSIDHPYMQELADRLSAATPEGLKKVMEGLPSRARSIVNALGNENTALKQQLEQVQTDLKNGITATHLMATTKAHDTETVAATKRHDTETRAATSLGVAAIGAASRLIDSRAERDHSTNQLASELMHSAAEAAKDRESLTAEAQSDQQRDDSASPTGVPQ